MRIKLTSLRRKRHEVLYNLHQIDLPTRKVTRYEPYTSSNLPDTQPLSTPRYIRSDTVSLSLWNIRFATNCRSRHATIYNLTCDAASVSPPDPSYPMYIAPLGLQPHTRAMLALASCAIHHTLIGSSPRS